MVNMDGNLVRIVGACILPNLGGFAGSLAMGKLRPDGWYDKLNRPSFRPPNWVFGPTWTMLYTGIGYASFLVWKNGGGFSGSAKIPLILYGTQLALNWAWTPIFFHFHQLKWSTIEIVALTGTAAACGISFFNVNKLAGLLFIPYVAWLSFASLLNYKYYDLNPKPIENCKSN